MVSSLKISSKNIQDFPVIGVPERHQLDCQILWSVYDRWQEIAV